MDFLDETLRSIGAMDPAPQPATTPQQTNPPVAQATISSPAPASPGHPPQSFLDRLRSRFAAAGTTGAMLVEFGWEVYQYFQDRQQQAELETERKLNELQAKQISAQAETDKRHDEELEELRKQILQLQQEVAALRGGTPSAPSNPEVTAKRRSRFAT